MAINTPEPDWWIARHGEVAAAFIRAGAAIPDETTIATNSDEPTGEPPVSLAEHRMVKAARAAWLKRRNA